MSLKGIENIVRELQKTVSLLSNKIVSLEAKILEQTVVISKLTHTSERSPTVVKSVQKSINVTAVADKQQRVIRNARAQASVGIAELCGAPNKRRIEREIIDVPPERNVAMNIKPISDKQTARVNDVVNKPSTSESSSTPVSSDEEMSDKEKQEKSVQNGNVWRVVNRQRKFKKRSTVVIGTAQNNDLQAAERLKHIQAWSFKPDTTKETILAFLNKIGKADYTVQKRDIKSDRHASFVIGIPENMFEKVTAPSVWPAGIRFAEWFLFRPRTSRGEHNE